MTKKDYIKIAECIKTAGKEDYYLDSVGRLAREAMLQSVAGHMSQMLRRDNPRFDSDKFMSACGFDK